MARGLSELQKTILCLMLDGREKGQSHLRSKDILMKVWGDRATIDRRAYNAAHASLSRTLTRLWQRGLIDIWKNLAGSATRISLTDIGAEVAHGIMGEKGRE